MLSDVVIPLEDCTNGSYTSNMNCPLAKALNRLIKPELEVVVGADDYDIRVREDRSYLINNIKFDDKAWDNNVMERAREDVKLQIEIPQEYLR